MNERTNPPASTAACPTCKSAVPLLVMADRYEKECDARESESGAPLYVKQRTIVDELRAEAGIVPAAPMTDAAILALARRCGFVIVPQSQQNVIDFARALLMGRDKEGR